MKTAHVLAVVALAVAVVLATTATATHSAQERRIIQLTQESAARQGIEAERELARQMEEADKLEGRIIITTYGERAQEAGIAPDAFGGTAGGELVLLALDSPQEVTARAHDEGSPERTRTASTVRLPDWLAAYVTDGEAVRVSVLSWCFWPSDISGALWDIEAQRASLDE